jgi:two-component system chemotaxis sensor kinase CheA
MVRVHALALYMESDWQYPELDREEILQTFLSETGEHLACLEQELLALEVDAGDPGNFNTALRVAHSIKGSASCIGLQPVAEFVHVIEDLLEAMRDSRVEVTTAIVSSLLLAIDALKSLIPEAIQGSARIGLSRAILLEQLAAYLPAESSAEDFAAAAPAGFDLRRGYDLESLAAASKGFRTLRVDISKLDRMLNLAGEITIAGGRLRQVVGEVDGPLRNRVEEAHGDVESLFDELRDLVNDVRMVPVGPTFRRFARTVRDLAVAHGKQARLEIDGLDVEIDTTVIEHIADPLTHLIRNALDHGIEEPAARIAAGKDPCGRITLSARHGSGEIVIQIQDDGAGLDTARIKTRAIEMGLIPDSGESSEQELCRLILEPGFSTAVALTDMSGRGVGMDVVRRNVEAIRGSIEIASRPGAGTCFTLRLPLTLAIIDGFGVGVAGETFFIPLALVTECLEAPQQHRDCTARVIDLRGKPLPYLDVRDAFGLDGAPPPRRNIVVVQHADGLAGLAVDALYGESQVVIKPMGKLFQGVAGVSGSTILGNGRVALILDVPALLRQAELRGPKGHAAAGGN